MLNELRRKFNVTDVTFYGRVSSDLKFRLLSKSHIVLMPAIRLPLRDSIRNGVTGKTRRTL
jgi:glycosyltransferase involved in cell wall biosynthesis